MSRILFGISVLAFAAGLMWPESPTAAAQTASNPIVTENQQPGTGSWQIGVNGFRISDDRAQQIKGYASATSVNKGETITLFVTVNPVQAFSIDVYRIGWYGGLGGRAMLHLENLPAIQQAPCPLDSTSGLIECNWVPTFVLNVPTNWTSGIYLAKLTNSQGYQDHIVFVVRDDGRAADLLYQQSVTTYQAYNNYPADGVTGKSLYGYNSYGANTIYGDRRAVKVSFDRPYSSESRSRGAGEFLAWEVYLVRWLEGMGYDVSYSTDLDTHTNGNRLLQYKGFISAGHDEYYSRPMYDALENARNNGKHLAFFGANDIYWQVRFEPSAGGRANRRMICYRKSALDPVADSALKTVRWRDAPLNRPEQKLIGVQFNISQVLNNVPYVVTNSGHWIYKGTKLSNGTQIPGLVGYEYDRFMSEYAKPANKSYTQLAKSPMVNQIGQSDYHNASIYQAPSGAWVFAAGTISWSWGLNRTGVLDRRIQRMTANLLNKFTGTSVKFRRLRKTTDIPIEGPMFSEHE